MANTIVITKQGNNNILVTNLSAKESLPPILRPTLEEGGEVVLIKDSRGSKIEQFNPIDVEKVVRKDGTETFIADVDTLFDELNNNFFFDPPNIITESVNTYADLPDPVVYDGEYRIVDQATGTWILGTRREKGIYKAVAGAWDYRGADVPYYLLDDQFTIKDSVDTTKQLGFQIDEISSGQRRIATWPDKNFIVGEQLYYNNVVASLSRPGQTTIGLINQQASTFETYLSLIVNPPRSGNYKLDLSLIHSYNNGQTNFIGNVRVFENAAIIFDENFINLEPKDTGGGGVVLNTLAAGLIGANTDSGTDMRSGNTYMRDFVLDNANSYTFELRWTGQNANNEATIHNAMMSIAERQIAIV